jgi:3-hydroxyisobutyrate dehydrogenase-like beta-hydroxyacid dehydrogenase
MLADPEAAAKVVFDEGGVLEGINPGHGYIDMSTVDEKTSRRSCEAIHAVGGRFLEAPVSGTRQPAIDGTLIILAAGDEELYREVGPLFEVLGKMNLFLGETGNAARMKLAVNAVMGGMMASFCEGLALAEEGGLSASDLLSVLDAGALSNPMFRVKGAQIQEGDFRPAFPLKHMQKDLRLAMALGHILGQEMPAVAAANGAFAKAVKTGDGDWDFCAVYRSIRNPAEQ